MIKDDRQHIVFQFVMTGDEYRPLETGGVLLWGSLVQRKFFCEIDVITSAKRDGRF